ncbi:MAG: hypothetical protein FGM46_08860 [Ferruginibacter sp.]|nr:hypothetical protein [Ferruginibacter sp.]
MIRLLFSLTFFLVTGFGCVAQSIDEMHANARFFIQRGDYDNAIIILNRGLQDAPGNIKFSKELALVYFYKNEFKKGLKVIVPLLDSSSADEQCFEIAGMFYKEQQDIEACKGVFQKGVIRFPESGSIRFELGEILWAQKKAEAIYEWEKGIQNDPSYPGNYYSACKFYGLTEDRPRELIYGEIFVNLEPNSKKTLEIKERLFKGYKKLFSETKLTNPNEKNIFIRNFLEVMNKQTAMAKLGITTGSLIMIKTRFILDWNNEYADKYPFKLFQYHQQLLQEGLFEAYNQWLFGATENLPAFQLWIQNHSQVFNEFSEFQKNRIFRLPKGQYYQ